MSKKRREVREQILELLRNNVQSTVEIQRRLGLDRRKFWYHKRVLIREGLVRNQNYGRKLQLVIDPKRIARKKHVEYVHKLLRSENPEVLELGIRELLSLTRQKVVVEKEFLKFLTKALKNQKFKEYKQQILESLMETIRNVRGTPYESKLADVLPKDLFLEVALNPAMDDGLRRWAVDLLTRQGRLDAFERLLELSEKSFAPIENEVRTMFLERLKRNPLQERTKLYTILEQSQDPSMKKRAREFLECTLDRLKWD